MSFWWRRRYFFLYCSTSSLIKTQCKNSLKNIQWKNKYCCCIDQCFSTIGLWYRSLMALIKVEREKKKNIDLFDNKYVMKRHFRYESRCPTNFYIPFLHLTNSCFRWKGVLIFFFHFVHAFRRWRSGFAPFPDASIRLSRVLRGAGGVPLSAGVEPCLPQMWWCFSLL